MTHDELKAELPRRPEPDVKKWAMEAWYFQNKCGTKPFNRPGYEEVIIRAFLHHNATYEIIICAYLGVPTEADMSTNAKVSASKSAKISMISAVVAVFISLGTLADSYFNFIPQRHRLPTQRTDAAEQVTEDTDALSSGGEPGSEQQRDADGRQGDAGQTDLVDRPGED